MEHPAQAAELIGYLWLNQPPAEIFRELTNRLTGTEYRRSRWKTRREQAMASFPFADGSRDVAVMIHTIC